MRKVDLDPGSVKNDVGLRTRRHELKTVARSRNRTLILFVLGPCSLSVDWLAQSVVGPGNSQFAGLLYLAACLT